MKGLLILILTFSIISSCDRKRTENTQLDLKPKTELEAEMKHEPKKLDTTIVYWQTDFDTIRKIQEVKLGNVTHQIELKTYSLNDSSIVRINDLNKPIIYKDVYHDNVTEILLKKGKRIIQKSELKKSTFKDSLDGDILKYSVLTNVEYDSICSNRIYFKAEMNVPDTDWVIGNEFAIYYQSEKNGQIDFWNFKDIGI